MSGPYARVYQSVKDDEKFKGVFEDDRLFATWVRLLMAAETAWPSSADIPRSARRASMLALESRRIIELVPGQRFRVVGLDAERQRRRDRAQTAADYRWHADSIADGNADSTAENMLVRERVRERVKNEDADTARASDADPVVQYANLTGGFPSKRAADWIDELTQTYGTDATIRALAIARKGGATGVIGRAQDTLRAEARDLSKKERDAEGQKVQARRVDGMLARRVEWFRNGGKWAPEWGPEPT